LTALKRLSPVLVAGVAAFLGVLAVKSFPLSIEPGSAAWSRLVRRAGPKGTVTGRARIRLPGIDRRTAPEILFRLQGVAARSRLGVSIDDGPVTRHLANRDGVLLVTLPKALVPGANVTIARLAGEPPLRIGAVEISRIPSTARVTVAVLAFLLTGALTYGFLLWKGPRFAAALGLLAAAIFSLLSSPALLWLTLPSAASVLRLALVLTLIAVSVMVTRGLERTERVVFWSSGALLAAVILGIWVRLYFLPSAGTWDMEYVKAWTERAAGHGVTRVYGDPDAVRPGHFLPQLRGDEPLWRIESAGRRYLIDYPPLAMVAWRVGWGIMEPLVGWDAVDPTEARNIAVKLPAVAGDVLVVLALFWLFRKRPWRAATLAALYWVLPISWLSSAVLGFQDETYAPFGMLAVVAAGMSRPVRAGASLALATMLKLLGLIVAPTVAIGLWAGRARMLWTLVAAGVVSVVVLMPFAWDGTLPAMSVQLLRQFRPGNLSSGFPNPWWIGGHAMGVLSGTTPSWSSPVSYFPLSRIAFPVGPVATLLTLVAVGWVCWQQRHRPGFEAAVWCGAMIFYAYAILAVGVFENHPHLAFVLFFASGLWSRRAQILCSTAMVSYLVNLLLRSGLGRFYGDRYMVLEPLAGWLGGLRTAPGFDLTLVLAVVNTAVFVALFATLNGELEVLSTREGLREDA